MRQDVAVERIDAAGCGPSIEDQVVGLTRSYRHGILHDWRGQGVTILRHYSKVAAVHMHWMHHLTRVNQADAHGLSMLEQDR